MASWSRSQEYTLNRPHTHRSFTLWHPGANLEFPSNRMSLFVNCGRKENPSFPFLLCPRQVPSLEERGRRRQQPAARGTTAAPRGQRHRVSTAVLSSLWFESIFVRFAKCQWKRSICARLRVHFSLIRFQCALLSLTSGSILLSS